MPECRTAACASVSGVSVPTHAPPRPCRHSRCASTVLTVIQRDRVQMRPELDVGFGLDVDRCRAVRHEGLIAHIRARYANDPDFELAIAEAEEHNRAYRVDMTGVG